MNTEQPKYTMEHVKDACELAVLLHSIPKGKQPLLLAAAEGFIQGMESQERYAEMFTSKQILFMPSGMFAYIRCNILSIRKSTFFTSYHFKSPPVPVFCICLLSQDSISRKMKADKESTKRGGITWQTLKSSGCRSWARS